MIFEAEVPDDLDLTQVEARADALCITKRGDERALPNVRWVSETIHNIEEVA